MKKLMMAVLATVAVGVPLGGAEAAKAPQLELTGTATSCAGDGCSWVKATRSGFMVTIYAQGTGYTPGKKVYVQVNVTDANGVLRWREIYGYYANSYGRTPVKTVFIDCNIGVFVQVWTWRANLTGYVAQPQAYTWA